MSRRTRAVTPDEVALWRRVVRDAQPLHGHAPLPDPEPSPAPARAESASTSPATVTTPLPARTPRRLDPTGPIDLDRRSWLKLRRGLYPIDARVDLHGLTQAEAHARLADFLAAAQLRGNRCVLVITGRGLRRGGTLRMMTPRWLVDPPNSERVLAYTEAQLRHGGEGALYVLLRRRP